MQDYKTDLIFKDGKTIHQASIYNAGTKKAEKRHNRFVGYILHNPLNYEECVLVPIEKYKEGMNFNNISQTIEGDTYYIPE